MSLHPSLEKVREFSRFAIGDALLIYTLDDVTQRIQMSLLPRAFESQIALHRPDLHDTLEIAVMPPGGWSPPPFSLDPLVHLKIKGSAYGWGFGNGATLRNTPDTDDLHFESQNVSEDGDKTTVETRLKLVSRPGVFAIHRVWWHARENGMRVQTTLENGDSEPLELEFLTAFSLGGITPFDAKDAPLRLHLHRFKSWWSAEGRLLSQRIEDLGLERAWGSGPVRVERFGQVGSMPVRNWFPFAALEDREIGAFWGVQLATMGSWQIEVARRDDFLCLSGGDADGDFGQWSAVVESGASFSSPIARLACVNGSLEDLCDALTDLGRRALESQPVQEREMPLACNDWCTHWGGNTHDKIVAMAERLRGTPVKYLVIDDGWQRVEDGGTQQIGDWNLNAQAFPHGMKALCDELRNRGFMPGIWFEFEACSPHAQAWAQEAHFLRRGGGVLQVGSRRFWDFRDPWVHEYLGQKVVAFLRDNGFGYLKVDYNDSIGVGCDAVENASATSLGAGLQEHLRGVRAFFERLRREIPDLVIENCSSGGHRLEPGLMELCAQASFSDAHESPEIPVIAANLHRLILPQQNQIWAVLHAEDTLQRLTYSLAAGFLGRLCISGAIAFLDDAQFSLVKQSLDFYTRVAPLIRDGESRRFGPTVVAYRAPQGWQGVRFQTETEALIIAHVFKNEGAANLEVPLEGDWKIVESLGETGEVAGGVWRCELENWSASVVHLRR